mmetsp:Transcript_27191/g.31365  ORF Transcript_27191/g.31365 Transcript_27191/m.31365 type:complete len:83 (-) Transcript_27191:27-275(-)
MGFVYLGSHFLVAHITMTIAIGCYFSFYFHCIIMVFLSCTCFWNGATFYMDYFSKKYEANLAKLDDVHKKISQDIKSDKKSD